MIIRRDKAKATAAAFEARNIGTQAFTGKPIAQDTAKNIPGCFPSVGIGASTGALIGTIFVDHQLRILKFTPSVTRIIDLTLNDVGRPVTHLVSNFVDYDRLAWDTQDVLDALMLKEVDVQTTEGKWYTMYIIPYQTLDNAIEGAAITFVDITVVKRTAAKLLESKLQFRTLIDQAPVTISVRTLRGICM